ncbi:hypothetical protein HKM21_01615 [Longimicrobium terrae]|uniref:Uncharacterized protein n=2 Tax=Longimicrobium terrae TaxID=1639882 RepID=A0A841GN91_9BACT|nr:hypothetical protein [Longimicrobium terrae]MBB6068782.1 hypothetical protein [Longimicrobium terrae]NNC27966.1 hypothetical protein [Longimicrobium terrae]
MAIVTAVSIHLAMVLLYGAMTDWNFSQPCTRNQPAIPPPFVIHFIQFAASPSDLFRDAPLTLIYRLNLLFWFVAILVLLHAMALVARLRVRLVAGATPTDRRIRLARWKDVRASHMAVLALLMIVPAAISGARARDAWLAEAERVLAATLSAVSAGRQAPDGVEFTMYEWVGDNLVDRRPEGAFVVEVDPAEAGDHVLDRFVRPFSYGGIIQFQSGKRYEFSVFRGHTSAPRDATGWTVWLESPPRPPARW